MSIKDLHGTPPTAAYAKQWLNNNREGGHIGKTPTFANAGKFSFTKWPCGKYCLAGFNGGLWQACPNENPGLTQYAEATEACLEFDVTEVPCNIRDGTTAYGTVAKINAVERSTASPIRKKKIKRTILPSHSVRLRMALLGTLTADSSRSCAARLTGLVILSSTTPLIQKPARKYVPQIRSVRVPLFTSRHPNVTISGSGRVSLRDLQMPTRKVTGSLSVHHKALNFGNPHEYQRWTLGVIPLLGSVISARW